MSSGHTPLAWAFYEQPVTVLVGWNLFAGLVVALLPPLRASTPQRGMGYAVGLAAVVPFALTVLFGYLLAPVFGASIDTSSLETVKAAFSFPDFYGQFVWRAIGALIGSYLA